MKIAILGYGSQGRAAYKYWGDGHDITICDKDENAAVPSNTKSQLGTPNYLRRLDRFDLIVRSPGVLPQDIVDANPEASRIMEKVTTVTNEFFRVCPTKNIIGVTGTKGKGTTSTLIARMLEADGQRVHLGGNIGIPPLDLLHDDIQPTDWVVLELANFQLIDLHYSPRIALCLLVVPEHLDWHRDAEEYFNAKSQLFRNQNADDVAIYYAKSENSEHIVSTSPGRKIPYMALPGSIIEGSTVMIDKQPVCEVSEIKLLGEHNWQNICAAVTAVWQITQNRDAIRSVLISFSGLPYRIEFRREVHDIRYYNDSYAASPPAPVAAIKAIPGKKVVIMGGFDRHLNLDDLVSDLQELDNQIRKLVLIGASAQRLADSLEKQQFTNFVISTADNMPDIVLEASKLAQSGDAVVLSPGFPSFDMFKNFEDRGLRFNAAVADL